MFREAAQGHDAAHEDSQRQGQIDQARGGIEQELEHHENAQALADHLIGIDPQELHVEEEQRHEEGDDERADEGPEQQSGGAFHLA